MSSKECVDGSSRCPICLFIGGDAAIHPWWLEQTFLAQKCITELKGRAFLLEHRFYGYSAPMYVNLINHEKVLKTQSQKHNQFPPNTGTEQH